MENKKSGWPHEYRIVTGSFVWALQWLCQAEESWQRMIGREGDKEHGVVVDYFGNFLLVDRNHPRKLHAAPLYLTEKVFRYNDWIPVTENVKWEDEEE
jgi:23S rRNA G2069 N7-methylase RlmK/C1962 C5-methylase RlmI